MALAGCVLSSFGEVTISWDGGKTTCASGATTAINQRDKTYTISGSNVEDDGTSISVQVPCTLVLDGLNLDNYQRDGVSSLRIESLAQNVKLFVKGRNFVASGSGAAGIFVAEGATLTIDSAADGSAVGELVAGCGQNGTGIGGYGPSGPYPKANCGKVVINGARITTLHRENTFRWSGGLGIPYDVSRGKVEINGGTLLLKNPYSICGENSVVINGGCVRCACDPAQGTGIKCVIPPSTAIGVCIPTNTNLNREVYPVELPLPAIDMTGARIEGLDAGIGLKDVMPLEGTGGKGTQSLFLYLPLKDQSFQIVSPFYLIRYDLKVKGTGFLVKSDVQKVNSSVRFDGQLKVDGVPQRGKEATFSVKDAGGATNRVAFTTDTNGFFAAALPINTKAGSTNVLLEAQVEGKGPFRLNHAMTVPVVPYALVADAVREEVLVADDRFAVVDASVTVTNDLTVVTNLMVNKNLSVAGLIQTSQESAADRHDLVGMSLTGEPRAEGRLHWFGKERELMTAELWSNGRQYRARLPIIKEDYLQWSAELIRDGAAPSDLFGATEDAGPGQGGMEYRCEARNRNFKIQEEPTGRHIENPHPYIKPGIPWAKSNEFNITSDGFFTVRIDTEDFGAVIFDLAVREEGSSQSWHYFWEGSHISGSDLREERRFEREYTIAVRKGDTISIRLRWYSALPLGGHLPDDEFKFSSKLKVRVAFRPFGLAD